ncbi:LLM class flavin-dependent oxidoreductase [Amycolatopsis sp. NPDC058986]|uniref:LLM class flavin-dependent oxidoreductase n=1 Tax=unclassified Amycolatopsis TaxID=2618356 RepID=UPI00366E940B
MIDVGLHFFPDCDHRSKPAKDYFAECLDLVELADELGYHHVRTVEHYFHAYGGYSPNPLLFLAAAAQRSKNLRLITGAVLPIFTNPLKLAGEIGMVDTISDGRLEVGFARAFLPHEFRRFGVDINESRSRFDEGIAAVEGLLEHENSAFSGQFHSFEETTSLPRPLQRPRPPFWIAAISSAKSFQRAGELGYGVMTTALQTSAMSSLIAAYRKAWREAGHPGDGRVMIAFQTYCAETSAEALEAPRDAVNHYLHSLIDAASDWAGTTSADYPGYPEMLAKMAEEDFDSSVKNGSMLAGTPEEVVESMLRYHEECGGFEIASLHAHFSTLDPALIRRSVELFGTRGIPRLRAMTGG